MVGLLAYGWPRSHLLIDPSVVRGLEYYTGPVFEAELLAEIPNEDGQIVRFGSVGGGGRYDGLVSRFRGEPVPATGFSIGVSRLMTALKALGKLDASDVIAPVVVLVMDRDTESLGRYQKMVSDLRQAGIRAEMYLGGSGMKPQMKYADRRGSPSWSSRAATSARRAWCRSRTWSKARGWPKRSPTIPPGAKAARRRSRWPRLTSSRRCGGLLRRRGRSGIVGRRHLGRDLAPPLIALPGTSPREERGEEASFDVGAPLSPFLRGEGKGEGRRGLWTSTSQ